MKCARQHCLAFFLQKYKGRYNTETYGKIRVFAPYFVLNSHFIRILGRLYVKKCVFLYVFCAILLEPLDIKKSASFADFLVRHGRFERSTFSSVD